LREQYIEQNKSTYEIADICNCSHTTVCRWLNEYDIQTFSGGYNPDLDNRIRNEQWLREQYAEKQKTTTEIADICNCTTGTVSKWLDEYNIETRLPGQITDKRLTDISWLREQYVEKQKSTYDIADICNCSAATVLNRLDEYNIETRLKKCPTDKRLTDISWLREQYVENEKTTIEIADICDCHAATVSKWLNKYNIETRSEPPADKRLTDISWLREQYVENEKTTIEIADICNCSAATVSRWLEKHDISTRGTGA
jgi:DNA-binding CsgD family transcriptional regulator